MLPDLFSLFFIYIGFNGKHISDCNPHTHPSDYLLNHSLPLLSLSDASVKKQKMMCKHNTITNQIHYIKECR